MKMFCYVCTLTILYILREQLGKVMPPILLCLSTTMDILGSEELWMISSGRFQKAAVLHSLCNKILVNIISPIKKFKALPKKGGDILPEITLRSVALYSNRHLTFHSILFHSDLKYRFAVSKYQYLSFCSIFH